LIQNALSVAENRLSKLALGTVQFGLNYGISNQSGKIKGAEVARILIRAAELGVDTFDTARAYGNSEQLLGALLDNNTNIITKVSSSTDVEQKLLESMRRLRRKKIYGLLAHSYVSATKNLQTWAEYVQVKEMGLVKKIGISLYYPHELEEIFKRELDIDIVQVPYNIFDQRFSCWFPELKKRGIEVHVRSVFLQGLFFLDTLPQYLEGISPQFSKFKSIVKASGVTTSAICLKFAIQNEYLDKVIIGVDTVINLEDNAQAVIQPALPADLYSDLKKLEVHDEQLILPTNWQ
jgi:aryl-alcohol dehydrogenase-like predicted oxidoreductase